MLRTAPRSRWSAAGAVWLAMVLPAAGTPAGGAATAEPAPGLSLAEVLHRTLAASPEIQAAAQQVESSRGAMAVARGSFDLQLESSGLASRSHGRDPLGAAAVQQQLTYEMGAARLFRNGIVVEPTVGITRTDFSTFPAAEVGNAAAVAVTMAVPLLRDRGGVVSAAAERATGYEYKSSRFGLEHTAAERVLAAAVAYWDYLAVQRRLEVFRASEERAQRTAAQTRVLVQAEERTGADLTQILGNLASKRVSRIAAEQALVEARLQLGLVAGMAADEIARLPPPTTGFPPVPEPGQPRAAPADLLGEAYARRADLRAAEQELSLAETLLEASRSELKPRLDVVVGAGYLSNERGPNFADFFAPLYRREPKLNGTLHLRYQFPAANSRARGTVLQSSAARTQRRIAQDDLRRRIAASVAVAAEALARGEAGTRESEEAVRLLEAAVVAEQRKFELGHSTLFDVIQAEEGLISALLGQIQSQRSYAVAIATLRFQSGRLLAGDADAPAVDAASLETPP